MMLDPESYIPVEVARRTDLARKTFQSAPLRAPSPVRASRLLAMLRLGSRPTPLA